MNGDPVTPAMVERIKIMRAAKATWAAIARELGIAKSTARVHGGARKHQGQKPIKTFAVLGNCGRCDSRIFDDGRAHVCLPTSATEFLGRRGEQNCSSDNGWRR